MLSSYDIIKMRIIRRFKRNFKIKINFFKQNEEFSATFWDEPLKCTSAEYRSFFTQCTNNLLKERTCILFSATVNKTILRSSVDRSSDWRRFALFPCSSTFDYRYISRICGIELSLTALVCVCVRVNVRV